MTAASAVLAGRAAAEKLMVDACTIDRPGVPATDPTTGVVTPALTTVYMGVCKVQGLDPQERTREAGGYIFTVQRYRVDVPVGAYSPEVGDLVTITSSTLDPYLSGPLRVVALLHKTFATAYRLMVTDRAV
jgi:hypothetical protein